MNQDLFNQAILQGIPNELPEPRIFDEKVNHAPVRKEILSISEKRLAVNCTPLF